MKKIFNIIAIAALSLALTTSCNDDFLDVTPTGVADGETVNNNPEKLVTAAYAILGDDWYQYPFNLCPHQSRD